MTNESKKLPSIVLEDLEKVMKEVTRELKPLLNKKMSPEERRLTQTFLGTLLVLTLDIFHYLPPKDQDEILTNCGTWFDIGMLLGRSPELLVEILNKIDPKVETVDIPAWLTGRLTGRLTSGEEG